MVQKILLGMEDNAGLAVVDLAAKKVDRISKGIHFTDDVEIMVAQGDYIWAADSDSSISVFTKDLVFLAHLDIGYWSVRNSGRWNAFHLHNGFLYLVSSRRRDAATYVVPVDQENQLVIRKFDSLTLQPVSEIVLDDPALWDDTGKRTLSSTYFWIGQHLWMNNMDNNDWSKLDIDTGLIVDTWAAGTPMLVAAWANADASIVVSEVSISANAANVITVANFVDKTSVDLNYDLGPAGVTAGQWTQEEVDFSGINSYARLGADWPVSVVSGGKLYFMADRTRVDGAPEQGHYTEFCQIALDLTTGVFTFGTWRNLLGLALPDADRFPSGRQPYDYFANFTAWKYYALSATQTLLWSDYYGLCLVDFSDDSHDYYKLPWSQGYSGDSAYIGSVLVIDVTETPVTGLVKQDLVAAAGRKVFLYDQDSGEKIDEAVSDNAGAYAMKKFTTRPAFEVSQSADNTKNYLVNAHVA